MAKNKEHQTQSSRLWVQGRCSEEGYPPYFFAIPPPFSCYQTLNVRADETNRLSLSQGPGFLSLGCCFIQGKQPQRPRVSEEAVYSGGGGGGGRGCLCAEAPIISFIYGGRKKSQPPAASSISHY